MKSHVLLGEKMINLDSDNRWIQAKEKYSLAFLHNAKGYLEA